MIRVEEVASGYGKGPRSNQEDYVIAPGGISPRVFVLCDGMGGHGHGEVASKTVAEEVFRCLKAHDEGDYTPQDLQDAVDLSLRQLKGADIYKDEKAMGTTLVVAVVNKENVLIGHIGDSRCYQFASDGNIIFRSRDHSMVQVAVDAEIITEEEAWNSPRKNLITRCITTSVSDVKIDVDTLDIRDEDTLLICSDGVSDTLRDPQISEIVCERDPIDIVERIKKECEERAQDNFSMIAILFSSSRKRDTGVQDGEGGLPDDMSTMMLSMDQMPCHRTDDLDAGGPVYPVEMEEDEDVEEGEEQEYDSVEEYEYPDEDEEQPVTEPAEYGEETQMPEENKWWKVYIFWLCFGVSVLIFAIVLLIIMLKK